MMKRLNNLSTLKIDPETKVGFTYNSKQYYGYKGDTIASALYANNVRIFSRSLKYHRPRGLYSLDGESSNTCMQVDGIPNVRCENTLLKQGMVIKEQNVKGSANNDILSFIDKLDWMMPAGFYYETMHRPSFIWPHAMKQIRKTAGLGHLSADFKMQGKYDDIFLNTDLCVIGGGPSGMSAAISAAKKGLRVVLLESRPWLGGFFEYRSKEYKTGLSLHQRANQLAKEVNDLENIRVFINTSMIGAYNNNLITGFITGQDEDSFDYRYIEIRAKSIVVATGCIERALIFEHNERPGVMQPGAVLRLAKTYGILAGEKAVFSVGHDLGLEAAIELHDLGLGVACIADIRQEGHDLLLIEEIKKRKIEFLAGFVATKAYGSKKVKKVSISSLDSLVVKTIDCDLLAASAGMTPLTAPITFVQGTLKYDDHTGFFLPDKLPLNMHVAGRLSGLDDATAIEASGKLAGLKAAFDNEKCLAAEIKKEEEKFKKLDKPSKGTTLIAAPVKGRKSFICFDEDTTIKNIKQAIDRGFDMPELIKRFTSAGTGPGQGGIPGDNLPLFTAKYQTKPLKSLKPTTVRPPLVPTLIAAYAGANHNMFKITPMDSMQRKDKGIFRNIGVWQRVRYFSDDFLCKKEIENVRNNVGILDGSTLGKFRIHGHDAQKALDRVYVSNISKIKEGRVKYSAMCNDDGCVIDDGIIVKQNENDYYFTTSTGRAGSTVEWIRYHTRYDNWDFHLVNLTDSMGVINLSGPNARKVLEKIVDIDVSNEAFKFSEYKEFKIKDTFFVRAMRLGFVGELSYELHVPSSYMQTLWLMLKEAGKEFNIKNFGVEAQNVLRMEKFHLILGQESEQRTNLLDVGLGFLWDRKKSDAKTVGAVALAQAKKDQTRLKLIGFEMEDSLKAAKDGSLIVDDKIRGYVCTSRYSFSLKKAVGMALVEAELTKLGTRLKIFEDECAGKLIYAKVVKTPFYDPEGKRMKM